MAKIKIPKNRRGLPIPKHLQEEETVKEKSTKVCVNCVHAHSPHELGANGEYFLVKCDISEWSKFARKDTCVRFEERKKEGRLSLERDRKKQLDSITQGLIF